MTLHFGDRTPADGTLRCERCGHGITLRDGDTVPRCYCGGDAFAHEPRRSSPAPLRPAQGEAYGGARTRGDPPR